jgi:hypothetical protein
MLDQPNEFVITLRREVEALAPASRWLECLQITAPLHIRKGAGAGVSRAS